MECDGLGVSVSLGAERELAIGAEENFEGVIDLVKMKAIYWRGDDQGLTFTEEDIPADLADQASEYREKLIELAVDQDEAAMENPYMGQMMLECGFPAEL